MNVLKNPLFWILFFSYLILAVVMSNFYQTARYIPYYLDSINWLELILSIIFTLVIATLVSLNVLYFKEKRKLNKSLSCTAALVGLSTGVCASCVSGVFPFLLSVLGISFSYALLPFHGLEVQFLTILVLIISLYLVKR